jgi:hypothetical protein
MADITGGVAVERHYRVKEIVALWGFSRSTVSGLFRNEEGVIRLGDRHVSLSIPESVLLRVHERLGNRPKASAGILRDVIRMGKCEKRKIIKLKRLT